MQLILRYPNLRSACGTYRHCETGEQHGPPGVSAGKFTVSRISQEALRRLKISFINENSKIGVQSTTRCSRPCHADQSGFESLAVFLDSELVASFAIFLEYCNI